MRNIRLRHGIVSVWFAVTGVIVLLMIALACDSAYIYLTAHQLQNAADAAALASAAKVKTSVATARARAIAIAADNFAARESVKVADNPANATSGDVVIGKYDKTKAPEVAFTETLVGANAVKVVARRTTGSQGGPLKLIFGSALKFNTAEIARTAIATTEGSRSAGIIVLDPSKPDALSSTGTSVLTVPNGGIQVNSSSNRGADITGGGTINAQSLWVTGNYKASNNSVLPGDIQTGADPIPDPLASIPPPTKGADLGSIKISSNKTQSATPGYYSGGIDMSNGTLNLSPGIYVLGPPGLSVSGGNLNAPNCMFYLTTGTGSKYGSVALTGGGTMNLSPPASGVYKDITFFQDRSTPNTSTNKSKIAGTSGLNLQGTIYMPSTEVELTGTSNNLGNQIIADIVTISGNGTLRINYDGRNPVGMNKVYLVN